MNKDFFKDLLKGKNLKLIIALFVIGFVVLVMADIRFVRMIKLK